MSAFKLTDLHDHWEALKQRGRIAADNIPQAIQAALKDLGLAEIDGADLILKP